MRASGVHPRPYATTNGAGALGLPLAGVAHQNGTIRFGRDARTSALDPNCKAWDVDNLYVVDGSFFPSSAAVNPALTIIANALRVGEHLRERLGTAAVVTARERFDIQRTAKQSTRPGSA